MAFPEGIPGSRNRKVALMIVGCGIGARVNELIIPGRSDEYEKKLIPGGIPDSRYRIAVLMMVGVVNG